MHIDSGCELPAWNEWWANHGVQSFLRSRWKRNGRMCPPLTLKSQTGN